ncbi:MAG: DinB family protein, partial [Dehalococcoidia bacterium]
WVSLAKLSHTRMKQALDGLADEQLWYIPAEGSNSIGWLVWHLARWKDIQTARAAGEDAVWASEGWHERFGLPVEASGSGDGPEQVATFRAERSLLLGYSEAAHEAAVRRVQDASDEQLLRDIPGIRPGAPARPAWRSLLINSIDFTEHTGQIAYLRGMLTGPGWM